MPVEEIAGTQIFRTLAGRGSRPALMLHCSLASSRAWFPLVQVLEPRLDMHLLDFPGHGKSADWSGVGDYHDLCTEVAVACLPEGRVDLIGHSFGGTVALRLAHTMPERVRSLTLIEPVFFATAFADRPEQRAAHEDLMSPFAEAWLSGDRVLAARRFSDLWGDGRAWESLPEEMQTKLVARIHTIPASHPALSNDRQGVLEPGALARLSCPVLLVEGSESPGIVSQINESLSRRFANARRVVVSGAGHMVPITHPKQVAREVQALLAESEPVA